MTGSAPLAHRPRFPFVRKQTSSQEGWRPRKGAAGSIPDEVIGMVSEPRKRLRGLIEA